MSDESDITQLLDEAWTAFAQGWELTRVATALMRNPDLADKARSVERLARETERAIVRLVSAWDRMPEGRMIRDRYDGKWTCPYCSGRHPLPPDGVLVCPKCGEIREETAA